MAFYGIPTPGLALTASTAGDTIQLFNNSTAVVSANTIIGLNGNDIINLGAEGYTASATTNVSTVVTLTAALSGGSASTIITGSLFGVDVEYKSALTVSGIISGATATTLSGSVSVSGVVTSENAVRRIVASQIFGNQDNDSIAFGTELVSLSASTIGGGAGNDVIGTYTYVNQQWAVAPGLTASTYTNSLIEGGGGNDVIRLDVSGSITTATIQGGAGNDSILIDAISFDAAQFLGGGDSDVLSGAFGTLSGSTIAGGGGNDALNISATTGNTMLIAGDVFNVSDSIYDGNDTIQIGFATASSISVQGGGGNDSIVFSALGGTNYLAGNLGNDTIFIQTGFSASTVYGGAGNDSILISGGFVGGSLIFGGGDKDTINFAGGDLASGAIFAGTVFGGLGADKFQASASAPSAGGTLGVTFGYSAYADSTISAMDSIAIGTTAASAVYVLDFVPAGLSLGSFSGSLATGSNGVVTFTSTMDTDVTSRYNVINADMTTLGATVTFKDGAGVNYVFIQGGTSDDLITQVGQTASGATISLGGGKLITIDTL